MVILKYFKAILTISKELLKHRLSCAIFNNYFLHFLNFIHGLNVSIHYYKVQVIMEDIPTVEPIDIPQYNYKNSKYEILPKLPARMIAVASSTGGKSVLIQNLILKIYRGSFERIYIHIYLAQVFMLMTLGRQ